MDQREDLVLPAADQIALGELAERSTVFDAPIRRLLALAPRPKTVRHPAP